MGPPGSQLPPSIVFDTHSGEISFSAGECRLAAGDDVLTMMAHAPDADQLAQVSKALRDSRWQDSSAAANVWRENRQDGS